MKTNYCKLLRIFILLFVLTNQVSYAQVNYLRTPDSRFARLEGYTYAPHYFYVNDYEGGQLRMHYIDEGPVGAPTVIMIHGNPTWIYQFRDIIPILNAAGYRTIAIDLMGMGRSDKPTDSLDYSYDRHVGWVTQFFTKIDSAFNLNEVTIFGHDYGTPIGIRMMTEHFPNRFDAFIDANASLPDGTFISPVHLNWRQFVRDNPNVPVGHIIAGSVNDTLTSAEIYGYYAPWPDSTYKMAIRTFPEMVPDDTTRPEAIANNLAWTFMEKYQKPFMTIFGKVDNNLFD
ncbi:MAG: alpha/beta fold hydrolase, partial [Bacteroidetes bacterium]|nr:alpha/beta fold hydrolase [Bacteroidota bacterium]